MGLLAAASFVLGTWGFWQNSPKCIPGFFDAAYRSLQLFFMNFELPETCAPSGSAVQAAEISFELHLARVGAFLTTVWAIRKALFPQARQYLSLSWRGVNDAHAIILG